MSAPRRMPDVSTMARPLRLIWAAVCVGGGMMMVVLGGLAASQPPALPEHAETFFYSLALLSAVGLAVAFWTIRRMEERLAVAGSDAEAQALVRTSGIVALAAAEVPTLAAAVATFLTGDVLTLALGVPLFLFAALTWPSDGRVGYWLSLRHAG